MAATAAYVSILRVPKGDTQRSGDAVNSPTWWAVGDAAVGLASRRRLEPGRYALLVSPLSVALPWLKDAGSQT